MEINNLNKEFILFTSCNFPTGGPGATYVNSFCKGVKENNGEIRVYLFKGYIYKDFKNNSGRKNQTDYGVKYTYLGFSTRSKSNVFKLFEDITSILSTFWLMTKLIFRRNGIIIFVYSNGLFFNLPVYFISKLFHIKIVSFVPEFLENEELEKENIIEQLISYSFLINYHFINKLSDKLIVFSNFLRNEYIHMGYEGRNIIIQPNLTELNGWYIPSENLYTIGYAGTPSIKDGIIDLMYAVKLLKDNGNLVNVIIVGDSTNKDSLIPYLHKKSIEFGIVEQITFTGLVSQDKVKYYLNQCQILSVTRPDTRQTKAGFPTKLGEYMACKKIVLATKFGDIENYFSDKIEIVLAEPGNPSSVADNILWILNNPDKSETIAKNAFNKATEILDYRNGVKKIMNYVIIDN